MKNNNSTTFCPVPWTQLATNSSGHYRVCCNATPVKNLVKNELDQVLNISRNPAEEAWNSPTYKKIRHQLINSIRPEMCKRCFTEEDSGVESARQRWVKKYDLNTIKSFDESFGIKYIDLRLGNLCNLKCRMCNPYASNKWITEWNSVVNTARLLPVHPIDDEEQQRLLKMDWPDHPQTWKNLENILQNVEEVYLTGGEPFLSEHHISLLQRLIDLNRAQDIIIKYNTNVTLIPKKILPLWKYFKSIKLNLSIDAAGNLNDYIRHPSRWSEIESNLLKFIELKNNKYPLEISIHTTVQMYNILDLHKTLRYFQDNFEILPYLNILNHPACLNIRTLPEVLKQEVLNNLANLKNIKTVVEVINYMLAENWSEKYFSDFLNYTKTLDENRNESLIGFFPQFFEKSFS